MKTAIEALEWMSDQCWEIATQEMNEGSPEIARGASWCALIIDKKLTKIHGTLRAGDRGRNE